MNDEQFTPAVAGDDEFEDDELEDAPGGGFPGAADIFSNLNMGALLGAAQSMQEQMAATQAQLASTVVEGTAGGGQVRVAVNGGFQFQSVHIAPEAIDPDDPSLLEDLVLAALRDASEQVTSLQTSNAGLGGIDLGGLDLGGLFGR